MKQLFGNAQKLVSFVFILVMLNVILLTSISALDFDNTLEYSEGDKVATITNAFGLGDKIARIELKTPDPNKVIDGPKRRVIIWDISNYGELYVNALKSMTIKNMNSGLIEVRSFHYEYAVYHEVDVPKYKDECYINDENKTATEVCNKVRDGSVKVRKIKEWKTLYTKDLPKGDITLAVVIDVRRGDYYDGIPEFFGKKITRHAEWLGSLDNEIIVYHSFDAGAGINVLDRTNSTVNGTFVGSNWTTEGKVNGGANFNTTSFVDSSDYIKSAVDFTVSFWFNATEENGTLRWIYGDNAASSSEIRVRAETTGQIKVDLTPAAHGAGNDVTTPQNYYNASWNHIVFTWDNANNNLSLYMNNVMVGSDDTTNFDVTRLTTANLTLGTVGGSAPFVGIMDEMGSWSRILTLSEIDNLFNDGVGIGYQATEPPTIILNTPTANQVFTTDSVTFNCTANTTSPVVNLTLVIDFIDNLTVVNASANENLSLLTTLQLPDGDHNWTCKARDNKNQAGTIGDRNFTMNLNVNITLVTPLNASALTKTSEDFNATYTSGIGLKNATYFIYNSTGFFNTSTFVGITGTVNNTFENIGGFTPDDYEWNVLTCDTAHDCSFATNNFTFNVSSATMTGEAYQNATIEGSTEIFQLNITILEGLQISTAKLNYNGTITSGTFANTGDENYTITKSITIPNVDATADFGFNWTVTFNDASTYKSPTKNQSVAVIAIDDCSTFGILMLNYSLRDEETLDFINTSESGENSTIEVDLNITSLSLGGQILTFSSIYNNTYLAQVCLDLNLNNTVYRLDTQARYESDTRVEEFHHLQNFSLTNESIPQKIDLFDLKTDDSTEFLITFKDNNFLPVENALIDITRKYVGEGLFRSVEIPKTDFTGAAVGHFDTDSVIYTIIVKKEGVILATFDNVAVICQDALIGNCDINLNVASTTVEFTEWSEVGGINFNMTFDRASRVVTTLFTTVDGSSKTVEINTTKFDRFGNTTVCTDRLTSSSGTLTCTVPESFGNVTVISRLYSDGDLITPATFYMAQDPTENFGYGGYVFLILMLLSIPLMFITSAVGIVIGVIVGLIMGALLLIYTGGSMLGVSSFVMWVIIAGIIIIWKINQGESV